ncbi:DNA endonuclease SmrA [Parendozoicomonas haliclonae]|uniref:Putative DNA endonuclease SmrA n=1 Tax=Parendozoicomonas haliclonae TaxID=1960125 RepID=A0A1X7AH24_9GAMM|nr:DNA endonuclease SmrA [Parendozoicomonas haliclonae]SMA41807.1 putative DNA endonuclease SmrA [Parendozoicomonas haliclonae]
MHENDSDLFFSEMSDVKPLAKTRNLAETGNKKENTPGQQLRREAAQEELIDPNPLSLELRKRLQPHDFLFWKESGVQEGVWKKLRLGKYATDAHLALHVLTVKEARQQLHEFLQDCREQNIRTVLVVHGRGENSEPKATIKSYTRQWLEEHDNVLAFHTALRQHGGTSAVYVLIRKNEEKRLQNRELFARRRPGVS